MNVIWNCTLLPPLERQQPLCLHSASQDWCLVETAFQQRDKLTKESENKVYVLFKSMLLSHVLSI